MISVIIPVYNVEQYLRECLESVVGQTYNDKEVLLIDDGSTDASGDICDEYAARYSYIRVFHEVNGGLSSARNRGIDEANGDWIIFMDSDDIWADKKCLTRLHNYAISLDLDVVRFEYQSVDENAEFIMSRTYDKSIVQNRILDNYDLVKYGIAGEWFAVLYLIKRDAIADLRFNEQTKFQEDADFYCRLFGARELRCGYLDDRMYYYRKRMSSITATYRVVNLKGSFGLCDVFYETSLKTNDERLRMLYVYYSVMMYYWTLQTLAATPYYEKRTDIIKDLQLTVLHRRVIKRMKITDVNWKYWPFIWPSPNWGVRILHFKDKIRGLIS